MKKQGLTGGVKRYAAKRAVEQVVTKPVTTAAGMGVKAVYDPRK